MLFHQRLDRSTLNGFVIFGGTILFFLYFTFYLNSPMNGIQLSLVDNVSLLFIDYLIRFLGLYFACVLLVDFLAVGSKHLYSFFKESHHYKSYSFSDAFDSTISSLSFYVNMIWVSFIVNEWIRFISFMHPSDGTYTIVDKFFSISLLIAFLTISTVIFIGVAIVQGLLCSYFSRFESVQKRFQTFFSHIPNMHRYFTSDLKWFMWMSLFFSFLGVVINVSWFKEFHEPFLFSFSYLPIIEYLFIPFLLFVIGSFVCYVSCLIGYWFIDESGSYRYLQRENHHTNNESKLVPSHVDEVVINSFEFESFLEKIQSRHSDIWNAGISLLEYQKTIYLLEDKLNAEDKHTVQRIIQDEAYELLFHFASLPIEFQEQKKEQVLHSLHTLQQELHDVINNVYTHHLQALDKTSQLIETRYNKRT